MCGSKSSLEILMPRVTADVRREVFIEAAMRVIAQHGVKGATTRRIAEEAKAPLATLHYCFQTKENLFQAVFDHHAVLLRTSCLGLGLAAGASQTLRATLLWFVENEDFTRSEMDLFLWATRQDDDLKLARGAFDVFISSIETPLRESLLPGDDPSLVPATARLLCSLLDGLLLQWLGYNDLDRMWADAHFAARFVEHSISDMRTGRLEISGAAVSV
jgi:AcrR family transcriptional regulator